MKTLSHPTRLAVLEILRDGEQCVCHMEAMLGLRQASISQQLMVLREAGLVSVRRDGLNMYYRVTRPQVFAVLDALERGIGKAAGLVLRTNTARPAARAQSAIRWMSRVPSNCKCRVAQREGASDEQHVLQHRSTRKGGLILPTDLAGSVAFEPGSQVSLRVTHEGLLVRPPLSQLRKVYIEPTSCCNLSCHMCIRNSWDEAPVHMEQADLRAPAGKPASAGTKACDRPWRVWRAAVPP